MKHQHIMVDLETWGVEPYSIITQIGACVFDPYERDPDKRIKQSFEVCVDPIGYQKIGGRVSADTVCWWMQDAQHDARESWLKTLKFEPALAWAGLMEWLEHCENALKAEDKDLQVKNLYWGNGADFDMPLLTQMAKLLNVETPWKFTDMRCFRTLKNLSGNIDYRPDHNKLSHTALGDALYQAHWAANIVQARTLIV